MVSEGKESRGSRESYQQIHELNLFKRRMWAAATVLGVGSVALLLGGAIGQSEATTKENLKINGEKIDRESLEHEIEGENQVVPVKTPFNEVFPDLFGQERGDIRNIIDEMKYEVIAKNSSYPDMVWVTGKNEPKIKEAAREFNIPEEIALGIVLIENGGGDDLTSSVGARGPAQLLENTARRFGLTVDSEVDERVDPNKCFKAMSQYLSTMREEFGGNLGIAVWGYHAGEGNVYSALREYFKDTEEVDLGDVGLVLENPVALPKLTAKYNQKIKETNLSVHQLLSNRAVRDNVLVFLEDETNLYVYKAVGGAELFGEEKAREVLSSSE